MPSLEADLHYPSAPRDSKSKGGVRAPPFLWGQDSCRTPTAVVVGEQEPEGRRHQRVNLGGLKWGEGGAANGKPLTTSITISCLRNRRRGAWSWWVGETRGLKN